MAVMRLCDRSGKPIPDKKIGTGDFSVSMHWAPALDGFAFDDLGDESRRQVLRYIATIAQRSGKEDFAEICRSALSTSGGPLFPPDAAGERQLAVAPHRLTEEEAHLHALTLPVHPDGTTCLSVGSWYVSADDAYFGPFDSEVAAIAMYQKIRAAMVPPPPLEDVPSPEICETPPPALSPDDGSVEERVGGWWFAIDGSWRGPKRTALLARRAYDAIAADRADADKARQKPPPARGR